MFKKLSIRTKLNIVLVAFVLSLVSTITLITTWNFNESFSKFNKHYEELRKENKQLINHTTKMAVDNSVNSLSQRSRNYLRRMALNTANEISQFLYRRDKDILGLASDYGINPTVDNFQERLRHFFESKRRSVYIHDTFSYDEGKGQWLSSANTVKSINVNIKDDEKYPDGFIYNNPLKTKNILLPIYKELSVVDLNGRETFKLSSIDKSLKDISKKRNTYIKAENYFKEVQKLKDGEIYVSEVIGAYQKSKVVGVYTKNKAKELNIKFRPEESAYAGIENPVGKRFEGIVRYITPLFKKGKKIGYLTLALDHRHIMNFTDHLSTTDDKIHYEASNSSNGNYAFILNNVGQAISHPRDYYIYGFDPATGERMPPWVSEKTYSKWKKSKYKNLKDYLKNNLAPFEDQSFDHKPSKVQKNAGIMGVDCRYAQFAPHCRGFNLVNKNGGDGSFYVHFNDDWGLDPVLTTVATIPYKTGNYGKTKRGFGFVVLHANIKNFQAPAVTTKTKIDGILASQNKNLESQLERFNLSAENEKRRFINSFIICAVAFIILGIVFILILSLKITKRIDNLNFGMKKMENNPEYSIQDEEKDEIGSVAATINKMAKSLKKSSENMAKAELSSRVMHNIESTISALDMHSQDIPELSEEKRTLLRNIVKRMRDICQGFKIENKVIGKKASYQVKTHLAAALLVPLISEKRLLFSSRPNIDIDFPLGKESYGLFIRVNGQCFQDVVSNVINNSVKAYGENSGKVAVDLRKNKSGKIVVSISDQAGGIPAPILPKVKEKGVSYWKESNGPKGQGLGLYDAEMKISNLGGQLNINSIEGVGTTVEIVLPQGDVPSWYLPKIKFTRKDTFVILDDDPTIHGVWKSRFAPYVDRYGVQLIHLRSATELRIWFLENEEKIDFKKYTFLFDYEIYELGKSNRPTSSGLELIRELELENNSILVTSHSENENIQKDCSEYGIYLAPKGLAAYIPMEFSERPKAIRLELDIDYIFIDDELTIRESWKHFAKRKDEKLHVFAHVNDFIKVMDQYRKDVQIYVDSKFADGTRGEVLSKKLFDAGFKNIKLATNSSKEDFEEMPWIKEIVGKQPPFVDEGMLASL